MAARRRRRVIRRGASRSLSAMPPRLIVGRGAGSGGCGFSSPSRERPGSRLRTGRCDHGRFPELLLGYLTVTQPHMLNSVKCGLRLQITR